MIYTICDGKIISAFKKYLEEKKIEFRIDWRPCAIAVLHINAEPQQRWDVQWGYCEIGWKIYG